MSHSPALWSEVQAPGLRQPPYGWGRCVLLGLSGSPLLGFSGPLGVTASWEGLLLPGFPSSQFLEITLFWRCLWGSARTPHISHTPPALGVGCPELSSPHFPGLPCVWCHHRSPGYRAHFHHLSHLPLGAAGQPHTHIPCKEEVPFRVRLGCWLSPLSWLLLVPWPYSVHRPLVGRVLPVFFFRGDSESAAGYL